MDKQVARTHLILLLVWMTSIEIESYLCHTHKVKELEGLFFCFLEGGDPCNPVHMRTLGYKKSLSLKGSKKLMRVSKF